MIDRSTAPALDRGQRLAPLDRLELIEVRIPQWRAFHSAVGVRTERRALLVRWWGPDGWGVGESSGRIDPYFNGEHLDGAVTMVADHVMPLLGSRSSEDEIRSALSRVRGWPFTTAALLAAMEDGFRRQGLPDDLDRLEAPAETRVPVGISLPLFQTPPDAIERVASALDEGYRRVKMKVAPEADFDIYRAVRSSFPDADLAFDANGSLGPDDLDRVAELAELQPLCVEQPFAPDRVDLAAELRRRVPHLEVCLDESVAALGHLVTAHAVGALDELNLKPGRVGGLRAAIDCLEYCHRHDLPVWIGGMFETGIGRAHNLRVAARCVGATAHDLSPSSRYFPRDLVTDPITMSDGLVTVPDRPVTIDEAALSELTVRRRELTPGRS